MAELGKGECKLASVTMPIAAAHVELATNAVMWLQRFYAGVEAQLTGNSVRLTGESFASAQLEQIWRAALVNEQSFVENQTKRLRLLGDLVR